jgi:hypothetical protein
MAAGPNIDSRRCILQPMHRPRPGCYARVGVCMRQEQRHAEFTAYIPKKNTASLAHPPRRGLPGVTCRNWPEGEQYDRGSGSVFS